MILTFLQPQADEINRLGELDILMGKEFAKAAKELIRQNPSYNITAIGSHGQTLRHDPAKGFTLQVGDPNIIAAETGIYDSCGFSQT